MTSKRKFVKTFDSPNGLTFGIDCKGNIWEMVFGSKTVGYKLAMTPAELRTVISQRSDAMKRDEIDARLRVLQNEREFLVKQKDQILPPRLLTSGGYSIGYKPDGRICIGCVKADQKMVDAVTRLVERLASKKKKKL